MYKCIAVCLLSLVVSGCGLVNGPKGPQGVPGINGTYTAPVELPQTDVEQVVADENSYRQLAGQALLSAGLSCTLYSVPNTTNSIASATGLVDSGSWPFTGVFDQPESDSGIGLNILPLPLQSAYKTWFIVKCTGYLVVADSQWHQFDLSSDDGSNLYVDGLLINNDGLHVTSTVSGSKLLKYGVHTFELDFFQGDGDQSLILNDNGSVMGSDGFYH